MKNKFIGFPIKDGCHVKGCDLGIDVLKEKVNIDKIIDIETNENDLISVVNNDTKLANEVYKCIKEGYTPITLGGDHSLAIGSIAGSAANYKNLGVIWFDTHPDINTDETTTTHNIHGYPLAATMGFGLDELTKLFEDKTKVNYENVVMICINDIDDPEQELINKYNIKNFTLDDINTRGIDDCLDEAIEYLNKKVKNVHLSFDIDSINSNECPGVNVPNRWKKGITKEQAMHSIERLTDELNVISMDIVEYNPLTDKDNKSLNIVLDTIKIINK